MGIEDESKWGTDEIEDSWGPPLPPPPAEMPPPPPPVSEVNFSRTKGASLPPPMPAPTPAPSSGEQTLAMPPQNPAPSSSVPKQPSLFSRILSEVDIKSIYCKVTSGKFVISSILILGFLMLILSESYANSANFTNAPDEPDTIDSSDYDLDNNGLNSSELENYTDALDQYDGDLDVYLNQLEEHNDLMNTYTGKSIFWSNVSSAFIVGGLVCLTFIPKAVDMSNSVRITLVIGTLYMLGGLLGYDLPGVDAAIGLGFGGTNP